MSDRRQGFVYAFGMRLVGTDSVFTKIGFSTDPERRFSEIERGVPGVMSVEFIIRGDEQKEATLHAMFQPMALGNEWFLNLHLQPLHVLLASEIAEVKTLFPEIPWWSDRHKNGHFAAVLNHTRGAMDSLRDANNHPFAGAAK